MCLSSFNPYFVRLHGRMVCTEDLKNEGEEESEQTDSAQGNCYSTDKKSSADRRSNLSRSAWHRPEVDALPNWAAFTFATMFTTPQTFHRAPDVWLSVGNTQLWYWPHGNRAVLVGKAVVITARVHCLLHRLHLFKDTWTIGVKSTYCLFRQLPTHVKRKMFKADVLLDSVSDFIIRKVYLIICFVRFCPYSRWKLYILTKFLHVYLCFK